MRNLLRRVQKLEAQSRRKASVRESEASAVISESLKSLTDDDLEALRELITRTNADDCGEFDNRELCVIMRWDETVAATARRMQFVSR